MLKELQEEKQTPVVENEMAEAATSSQIGKAGNEKSIARPSGSESPEIIEEVVIEEVSIDGMCGVY